MAVTVRLLDGAGERALNRSNKLGVWVGGVGGGVVLGTKTGVGATCTAAMGGWGAGEEGLLTRWLAGGLEGLRVRGGVGGGGRSFLRLFCQLGCVTESVALYDFSFGGAGARPCIPLVCTRNSQSVSLGLVSGTSNKYKL